MRPGLASFATGRAWARPAHATFGAALLVAAVAATPARSEAGPFSAASETPRRWFSIGVLGGSTQWNSKLADYQWSVTPRAGFGGEAMAGFGRLEAGIRFVRTGTSQAIGVPGAIDQTRVHATSFEVVTRARVWEWHQVQSLATVSTGLLHLGYDPDRVSIPSGSGSTEVSFDPINAWAVGAGVALRRPLGGAWRMGVDVEQEMFALDTAHRQGGAIEQGRTSFGDWSARFELARIFARP